MLLAHILTAEWVSSSCMSEAPLVSHRGAMPRSLHHRPTHSCLSFQDMPASRAKVSLPRCGVCDVRVACDVHGGCVGQCLCLLLQATGVPFAEEVTWSLSGQPTRVLRVRRHPVLHQLQLLAQHAGINAAGDSLEVLVAPPDAGQPGAKAAPDTKLGGQHWAAQGHVEGRTALRDSHDTRPGTRPGTSQLHSCFSLQLHSQYLAQLPQLWPQQEPSAAPATEARPPQLGSWQEATLREAPAAPQRGQSPEPGTQAARWPKQSPSGEMELVPGAWAQLEGYGLSVTASLDASESVRAHQACSSPHRETSC